MLSICMRCSHMREVEPKGDGERHAIFEVSN